MSRGHWLHQKIDSKQNKLVSRFISSQSIFCDLALNNCRLQRESAWNWATTISIRDSLKLNKSHHWNNLFPTIGYSIFLWVLEKFIMHIGLTGYRLLRRQWWDDPLGIVISCRENIMLFISWNFNDDTGIYMYVVRRKRDFWNIAASSIRPKLNGELNCL